MPTSYMPTKDASLQQARGPSDPAAKAAAVLPSDTADLPAYAKALRIFVPSTIPTASVVVTPLLADDDTGTVTLHVTAGVTFEPLSVRRVWATGTTAGLVITAYLS